METGKEVTRHRYMALVSAAAFAAAYSASMWISRAAVPTSVKYAAAVAALVAFAVFLAAEVGLIRRLDELQRLVQLEALAIAFPLSLALVMFLGLVERFTELPIDDLSYRHIWPLMVFFYAVGIALAMPRYR